MTSKNILWLGSLLFALLCTSCIAWFLDKHNPQIQQVDYQSSTNNTIVVDDPFAQKVEIDEFITDHIKKEAKELNQALISQKDIKEENNSLAKTKVKKPILIANKIDQKIIPKTKPVKKVQKIKREIKKEPFYHNTKKIIQIEPLLYTIELDTKKNYLTKENKSILHDFVIEAKKHPFSKIKIDLPNLTIKNRNYLKAIKRYFYKNSINPKRVYVKVQKSTFPVQIVKNQKSTSVEILLIERL